MEKLHNSLLQTVSAIYTFFLAMTLYPDTQKKAQQELVSIVGTDRIPTYSDRANLPYVDALVQEVLRWNPVTPLGGLLLFMLRAIPVPSRC